MKFLVFNDGSKYSVDREIHHLKLAIKGLDPCYFASFYESEQVPGMMAVVMELVFGVKLSNFFKLNRYDGLTEFSVHKIFQDVFRGTFIRWHSTIRIERTAES